MKANFLKIFAIVAVVGAVFAGGAQANYYAPLSDKDLKAMETLKEDAKKAPPTNPSMMERTKIAAIKAKTCGSDCSTERCYYSQTFFKEVCDKCPSASVSRCKDAAKVAADHLQLTDGQQSTEIGLRVVNPDIQKRYEKIDVERPLDKVCDSECTQNSCFDSPSLGELCVKKCHKEKIKNCTKGLEQAKANIAKAKANKTAADPFLGK